MARNHKKIFQTKKTGILMPVFCFHDKYEMIVPLRGFSNVMAKIELNETCKLFRFRPLTGIW